MAVVLGNLGGAYIQLDDYAKARETASARARDRRTGVRPRPPGRGRAPIAAVSQSAELIHAKPLQERALAIDVIVPPGRFEYRRCAAALRVSTVWSVCRSDARREPIAPSNSTRERGARHDGTPARPSRRPCGHDGGAALQTLSKRTRNATWVFASGYMSARRHESATGR